MSSFNGEEVYVRVEDDEGVGTVGVYANSFGDLDPPVSIAQQRTTRFCVTLKLIQI